MVYRPGTLDDNLVLARNNQKILNEIRNANRPTGTMWNDTTKRLTDLESSEEGRDQGMNDLKESLESIKESLEALNKRLANAEATIAPEIVFAQAKAPPEGYELFCSLNTPGGLLYVHKRIEE